MNYIELKHSNIRISKLGLGSWAIGGGTYWGENNDAESVKTIHTALEPVSYTHLDVYKRQAEHLDNDSRPSA